MISIKEVETATELVQAQNIRVEVLESEQGFSHEVNIDGRDETASHVLILDDGLPVATARLTAEGEGEGMIERIATLRSHRGRGLGKRLIQTLESVAERRGVHTVSIEPHAHLEEFFDQLGYKRVAPPRTVGEHRLVKLRKRL